MELKESIKKIIQQFANQNSTKNAIDLFNILGYNTALKATQSQNSYQDFYNNFVQNSDKKQNFNPTKALANDWLRFDFLFQIDEKLTGISGGKINNQIINNVIFMTINLQNKPYYRTQLAEITRQINLIFGSPVVILFQYNNHISLSIIHRRINLKDEQKDVLEKVSFIKDIDITNPHRAQIEILNDFAFNNLSSKKQPSNFVELTLAWETVFKTKKLNDAFYKELFNWYLWAVQLAKFPKPKSDTTPDTTYQSQAVIRLITRLIFVWFLKEKKLIEDVTFQIENLKKLLKDFNPNDIENSNFYNGIVQNLFFATLNSPLDKDAIDDYEKRQFIDDAKKNPKDTTTYNDQTKYRGIELFEKPEDLIQLFQDIPFLNGGLFECLDRQEDRQDGFSVNANKRAFVPNVLFFGNTTADLSIELKDKKASKTAVKGIIEILYDYKFTIEENTPLEEDIALDPELLGKVFENLLASYNPETKDAVTARKQTGSFYTPREIVDYMVSESLLAYMQNYFPELQSFESIESLDEDLKYIFVKKLTDIKILDPACGSGAYPMGVLNKMVEIIKKADPNNSILKEIQKERIIGDKKADLLADKEQIKNLSDSQVKEKAMQAVEERLADLENIFNKEYEDSNYLRKLFLIEYCIFGVDIQTIAIQISKLRFFISLLIDQKTDDLQPNRGILSMPNLETKFVAANTLIGLETVKNGQIELTNENVTKIEKELDELRHRIFYLKKFTDKKKLKAQETAKRAELKLALIDSGMNEATATQKADWNPFDILQSARFFDPKTMFGLNPNQSNHLIGQLNLQIDAINKQIDAINNSFKIDLHKVINLQTQIIDNQLNIIQIELDFIAKRISKIYGEINNSVKDIVSEPKNYDYELYPVKTKIGTINQQLQELKSNLSSSPSMGVFDVVIGNPPYVQMQKDGGYLAELYKNQNFETFERTGDIYSLFYEQGIKLLKQKGNLNYITSNKWMRAKYGESLRTFFIKNNPVKLIDLGAGVFENATVDTNIILVTKQENQNNCLALDLTKVKNITDFKQFENNWTVIKNLTRDSWAILSGVEEIIKQKIEIIGKPLKDWDININYGIKTGFNEAFIIDTVTKEKLCKEDPKSAEIIKPILRGKDIKKYKADWAGFWQITTHNGYKENDKRIPRIDVENYPAIKKHLDKFLPQLTKRSDKGDTPYNLRNCAYMNDFEKEKIVWNRIASVKEFSLVEKGMLVQDSMHFFTGNDLTLLIGILSSKVIKWLLFFIIGEAAGGNAGNADNIKILPVPAIPLPSQQPFIVLVNKILQDKKTAQDTSHLEHQIDVMVYHLYGLSYQEACVIDGALKVADFKKYKIEI